MSQLSIKEIAERLADRAASLVPELLPGGGYSAGRRDWRCGGVNGDAGSSLRVWLAGSKRGHWRDYKSGQRGDMLDLVAAVRGQTLGDAYRWAAGWLGGEAALSPPMMRERSRREVEERTREERQQLLDHQNALRVWLAAKPLQFGDLACRYLDGRGIEVDALPRLPAALRCHPELWNAESGRAWPALVAAICDPNGKTVNVHRIWLDQRSDGTVGKAPLEKPKLSMRGGYQGGCIRLWRGASGRPWNKMSDGETVVVGEGIEDTLSMVELCPDWRACAVLSVSSLEALVLPPQCTRLIWLKQNDMPGSPAARCLQRAIRAHQKAGRRVALLEGVAPQLKDVNDVFRLAAA